LVFRRGFVVSAIVNGIPIFRTTVISELESQGGNQVLENLINEKLIIQEANNKNITVSDDEINKEIENIRTSILASGSTLEDYMTSQNITMKSLKKNVYVRKLLEKIFADKANVSDDEIKSYFDQNKSYYGEAKFEDVATEIKQQLITQKLSSEYSTWIESKKSSSKILILTKY
jgi:foldase protein PrsA